MAPGEGVGLIGISGDSLFPRGQGGVSSPSSTREASQIVCMCAVRSLIGEQPGARVAAPDGGGGRSRCSRFLAAAWLHASLFYRVVLLR